MDDKLINRLLIISSGGLTLSAIIFICLAIFTEGNDNVYLGVALGSIILSGLFNIIRNQNKN